MSPDLVDALEALARRGEERGAEAVVEAALLAAGAPQPRRTPTWRLALRGAIAATIVLGLLAGGGALYLYRKITAIPTVDLDGDLRARPANFAKPVNVLLVGSDQRADLGGPPRSDVLMVLRIDEHLGRASLLSLPRDLWVPVDGTGRQQRINTAIQQGPAAVVAAVSTLLDLPLDHYVEVDFEGFRRLVDVVGGVEVPFPHASRDRRSGLHVTAGCRELDGDQALALVRSRAFEELRDGRWISDPTGDLGRIQRQQDFLVRAAIAAGSATNPLTLNRLLDVAGSHLRVDDTLRGRRLLDFLRHVRDVDPQATARFTLTGRPTTVAGAQVLVPDVGEVRRTVAAFTGDTPTPPTAPTPESPSAPVSPDC
jgi:LCP family protein required for cell wall assembly